ncbi:MAG: SH3 domain-containing protein [Candidatus Malihini olakiniferum]
MCRSEYSHKRNPYQGGLPTEDPTYDNPRQVEKRYPFDNLQISSIRPSTPIYVLTVSHDKRWRYITSPPR